MLRLQSWIDPSNLRKHKTTRPEPRYSDSATTLCGQRGYLSEMTYRATSDRRFKKCNPAGESSTDLRLSGRLRPLIASPPAIGISCCHPVHNISIHFSPMIANALGSLERIDFQEKSMEGMESSCFHLTYCLSAEPEVLAGIVVGDGPSRRPAT